MPGSLNARPRRGSLDWNRPITFRPGCRAAAERKAAAFDGERLSSGVTPATANGPFPRAESFHSDSEANWPERRPTYGATKVTNRLTFPLVASASAAAEANELCSPGKVLATSAPASPARRCRSRFSLRLYCAWETSASATVTARPTTRASTGSQSGDRLASVSRPSMTRRSDAPVNARLRGDQIDRDAVQDGVARERIDKRLVGERVAVRARMPRGHTHSHAVQIVPPAVRDAHHPGHDFLSDLDLDLDRPHARGHPRPLPVHKVPPAGVVRVDVHGAALLAPDQRLEVVHPRVVRAQLATADEHRLIGRRAIEGRPETWDVGGNRLGGELDTTAGRTRHLRNPLRQ